MEQQGATVAGTPMASYSVLSHKVVSDIELEFYWKIVDWPKIQQSRASVAEQMNVVEVGPTRWEFYFRENDANHSMMCMKLVDLKDAKDAWVSTTVELLHADGTVNRTQETEPVVLTVNTAGVDVGIPDLIFGYPEDDSLWSGFITEGNELVHRIMMSVKYTMNKQLPAVLPQFGNTSLARLQDNFETLLFLEEFQNFKIITKDGKEFMVNKHILSSRCPVFESMFRSKMVEEKSGQVHVKDVSGAAMEILIKFWYTGKLADNWKEPGVVNDFTSAVGKYGITELLEFLDAALGKEDVVKSSLELVERVAKLGLKEAEKGLVRNIGKKAYKAETMQDLYAALGLS